MDSVYYYTGLVTIWALAIFAIIVHLYLLFQVLIRIRLIEMFVELHRLPRFIFRVWQKTPEQIDEIRFFHRNNKLYKKCHFRVFYGILCMVTELKNN